MTRFTDQLPAEEPSPRGRRPLHYVVLALCVVVLIVILLVI